MGKRISHLAIIMVAAATVLAVAVMPLARDRGKGEPARASQARTALGSPQPENITGSTVNSVFPSMVPPGTATTLTFSVTHVDNDYEYLDRFDVDLPDAWTVNSVTNTPDNNGCGDGTTQGVSAGNVVYWQTVGTLPTNCGSWDSVTVSFSVNVTVPDCTGAPWTVPWHLIGDGYGGAPHSITGSISLSCGVPTGAPVLVISPDTSGGSIASLLAALSAYPDYHPVVWNNASGNPTAADMAPYCAVVVGNNYQWTAASLDKTAIGNALADYLDAGGHVIESEFIQSYDAWGFAGRYMTGGYSAFTPATLDHGSADTMTIVVPAHPVMAGVTSIGDAYQQNPGLAAGATLLARWSGTSYNAVAVKPNVVALNWVLCDSPSWTGDVALLLHNALTWMCASTPSPSVQVNGRTFVDHCASGGPGNLNGIVEPGENIDLTVTLRNAGSAAATGVSVTLTSPTAGVTILDGTAAYPNLASSGSGTNLDSLTLVVGRSVACLTVITVNVAITANEGSWTGSFTLDVGQAGSAVTDFAQNFDSTTPPALPTGWLTQVITGNAWANSNYNSCSSPNALRYPYNASQAANSWAYTPGISLSAGTTYTLNFAYKTQSSGAFPEGLEVWVGTGQVNSSMTNMIWSRLNFVSSTCSAAAPTFTVPSAGTYYIGFHCVSAADEYYLYVDTIQLTHTAVGICNLCACPTITLSPATLPDGAVGTAYNQTVTASGGTGTYTFAVTAGSTPTSVNLAADGTLAGTPTASGTFSFTVTATDQAGCTGSLAYTIRICPVIGITPATLPNGVVGTAYNQTLAGTGGTGPYTFAVTTGSTPTGVNLAAGGSVSGTPTAAGTFNFTVTATDAQSCTGSQAYSVQVNCPTITVNPATLPGGTVGTAYSQTITASGGTGPYTYAIAAGTQPTGLTLAAGGLLSGTPTAAGTFNFTVTATDTHSCTGSQAYAVQIVCPAITVSPASLPGGTVGTAYSQTVTASGGTAPYTYAITAGTQPTGLTLSSGGLLSGTPTAAGTFNFTVTATDAYACTGSQAYSVQMLCPTITVSPATLPAGTMGAAYSQTITASGGTAPYTYAVTAGAQPTGLTLSSGGLLSGTPTATGTFTFTVTATDTYRCTGTRSYSIAIVYAYGTYFLDTYGRSRMCANFSTGTFIWNVLTGPDAGDTFAGTCIVTETPTTTTFTTPPGSAPKVNLVFYKNAKTAAGSCVSGSVISSLVDTNTLDNPPSTCQ